MSRDCTMSIIQFGKHDVPVFLQCQEPGILPNLTGAAYTVCLQVFSSAVKCQKKKKYSYQHGRTTHGRWRQAQLKRQFLNPTYGWKYFAFEVNNQGLIINLQKKAMQTVPPSFLDQSRKHFQSSLTPQKTYSSSLLSLSTYNTFLFETAGIAV